METVGFFGLFAILIATLIFITIIGTIIYFLVKVGRKNERSANEKLEIESEHTIQLQKRVDHLEERLVVIEKMLKEVE